MEKTAVRSPLLGARATQVFDLARLQKAPIAVEAVARIDALLAIEREISGLAPEQRVQRAQPALVLAQKIWLRQQLAKLSRRSESVTAIDYSLKRWTVLTRRRPPVHGQQCCRARRALRRGRAQELDLRGPDESGHRTAAIYTLIETAKLNDSDSQASLADLLTF